VKKVVQTPRVVIRNFCYNQLWQGAVVITILGRLFLDSNLRPSIHGSLRNIQFSDQIPANYEQSPERTAESFVSNTVFHSDGARAIIFWQAKYCFIQGALHGMDHTATRRDRPELRNQLVRQRRAVVR
jgi:hypothetical protein